MASGNPRGPTRAPPATSGMVQKTPAIQSTATSSRMVPASRSLLTCVTPALSLLLFEADLLHQIADFLVVGGDLLAEFVGREVSSARSRCSSPPSGIPARRPLPWRPSAAWRLPPAACRPAPQARATSTRSSPVAPALSQVGASMPVDSDILGGDAEHGQRAGLDMRYNFAREAQHAVDAAGQEFGHLAALPARDVVHLDDRAD